MRIRSIHQSLSVDKAIVPSGKIVFQPLEDMPMFEANVPDEVGQYLLDVDAASGRDKEGKPCPKSDFIRISDFEPVAKIKRPPVASVVLNADEQELIEFFRAFSEDDREDLMENMRNERARHKEIRERRKRGEDPRVGDRHQSGGEDNGTEETRQVLQTEQTQQTPVQGVTETEDAKGGKKKVAQQR